MINLKIGKNKVDLPNDWSELTISKYTRLLEIYAKHNILTSEDKEEHSEQQYEYLSVKANIEALSYLTDVDKETIKQCKQTEITLVLQYMTNFLNEVNETTFKDVKDNEKSFTYKQKTYFYPSFKFKDTTFGDYIEASQLNNLIDKQKGGRFSVLPEQMAIMCKEQNEESYNEKLINKKTRIFEDLPMNIVWDFVFFLTSQTNIWEKNFQSYSKTATESVIDTQKQILI